jgi:hypothetical protein
MFGKLHDALTPRLDGAGDAGNAGGSGGLPGNGVAGKPGPSSTFKSQEELAKGYDNQFNETQRLIAEAKTRDGAQASRIAELEGAMRELLAGNGSGAGRNNGADEIEAELRANYIPVDALNKYVERLVDGRIDTRVLGPIGAASTARETATALYGDDFASFEANRNEFFKENPHIKTEYEKAVSTSQPETALHLAMGHFKAWKAANAGRLSASGAEQQAAARRHASLLGGQAPPTASEIEEHNKVLKAAKETYARTGKLDDFLAVRFKGTSIEKHSTGGTR